MQHQQVTEFAAKVKQIDRAIYMEVDGDMIRGTYRGKKQNEFVYSFSMKQFLKKSAAWQVGEAFEQAAR